MVVNLWTVPLLLQTLGHSDYGLYQLIAGTITMLSFLNVAMTGSTQRYMSVTMGKNGNEKQLNTIYNVSIVMHFLIGLVIVIILESCTPILFNGFLNIPPERVTTAEIIYQFLIVSTFFTIIAVPFDAVLNAYENMVVFAIISIIDALLKLSIAFSLTLLSGDRLIIYGIGMAGIAVFNTMAKYIYTRKKYKIMSPDIHCFNKNIFKDMLRFAGWTTYGSLAFVCRNQGIAIVLNKFFGTIINASYGIANQINGLVTYFSATLQKSINPQLMKSEGMQDRQRMLNIAFMASKYTVLITLILIVPLIVEMPFIMHVWLKNVPQYAVTFAILTLVVSIINQSTAGLMSAIQSSGRIKNYQLAVGTIEILNIPVSAIVIYAWRNPIYVYAVMIIIEIICTGLRIAFASKIVQADWKQFCKHILLPLTLIALMSSFMIYICSRFFSPSIISIILEYIISSSIIIGLAWIWLFGEEEKTYIINLLPTVQKK